MSDPAHKAVAIVEQRDVEKMSPVVAAGMAILAQSPSPETLRELLAVQKEWEANEARKAYARAMVDLKRDLPAVISKDRTVRFGDTHYTHASLANIMEKIDEAMVQHGFSVSWVPSTTADGVTVLCRLTHAAGHSESTSMTAPRDSSGKKNPVQQIGSTVTYLQRYTVLALLGIATSDQPDADEQHGDAPDPSKVDTERNMKAVVALKKYGRTKDEAEAHLGRKVPDWTTADLGKLKLWLVPPADDPHSYGPPPMSDEPGSNG